VGTAQPNQGLGPTIWPRSDCTITVKSCASPPASAILLQGQGKEARCGTRGGVCLVSWLSIIKENSFTTKGVPHTKNFPWRTVPAAQSCGKRTR
jgi:hypothetical protein